MPAGSIARSVREDPQCVREAPRPPRPHSPSSVLCRSCGAAQHGVCRNLSSAPVCRARSMAQCPESEMSDDSTVQTDAILQAEASIRSDAIDPMNRDQIVHRFALWLDAVLSAEAPPEGIDAGLLAACTDANGDADRKTDEPNDADAGW